MGDPYEKEAEPMYAEAARTIAGIGADDTAIGLVRAVLLSAHRAGEESMRERAAMRLAADCFQDQAEIVRALPLLENGGG
jgi:hypothetical protein